MDNISEIEAKINVLKGKRESVTDSISKLKEALSAIESQIETITKAATITNKVANETQEQIQVKISSIVTLALNTAFNENYAFKIRFETKRGRPEALIMVEKDGNEIFPMDEDSGGLVDIVSFSLRLSCLLLHTPVLRRTVIMDEPFRCPSKDMHDKIGHLLQSLSEKLNIQFIIVTHEAGLTIGNTIDLGGSNA